MRNPTLAAEFVPLFLLWTLAPGGLPRNDFPTALPIEPEGKGEDEEADTEDVGEEGGVSSEGGETGERGDVGVETDVDGSLGFDSEATAPESESDCGSPFASRRSNPKVGGRQRAKTSVYSCTGRGRKQFSSFCLSVRSVSKVDEAYRSFFFCHIFRFSWHIPEYLARHGRIRVPTSWNKGSENVSMKKT